MCFQLSQVTISYIPPGQSAIWSTERLFAPGKYYHIRAQSGKGKSSFIHTLYGLQRNYTGQLYFKGKLTATQSPDDWCDLRAKQLSIVFQDLRLFADQTAWQNLLVKNELTAYTDEMTIRAYAERLGVAHTLQRPISSLSYGERQRVAIIRSVLQPFDCILLDEPFSHLDNENTARAALFLQEEAAKRQATLILCDLEPDDHFPYHEKLNL